MKTKIGLLAGGLLLSWNVDAVACARPYAPVSELVIEGLETPEIPRNGAIVIRTNRRAEVGGWFETQKAELTCKVFSGERELSGTLKNWPEGGFSAIERVAWIPASHLPENAQLDFSCTAVGSGSELFRGTVKTYARLARDVSVGAISVHVEERGRDLYECSSNNTCGDDCEPVGTEYYKWAVITVPRPNGGFTVGGYELAPRIDPSSVNYPYYLGDSDGATSSAYNTFTEGGYFKVAVFLPPSDSAYTPCYTIDVNALSGSVRSQPVCLPAGKYEKRTLENGSCALAGGVSSSSSNAWYVVGVFALSAWMRRRKF